MSQRHPPTAFMTGDTEVLIVMTLPTISRLASGIQSVSIDIIQIMNLTEDIIPPMTVKTEILPRMAFAAPLRLR